MSELNKTYRVRTDIGSDLTKEYIELDANLVQEYETFDILSVKIDSVDTYKLHNANYGVVVGRVLANNGFGVPNAKISIFIPYDSEDGDKIRELYPFISTSYRNKNGFRYNLLPDEKVSDCHKVVGSFPNKRFALDNDIMLEVFDKYYKYTTRTNNAGDYLIMGVPVGAHTLHMDLDLSDCGMLSQRPRDFVYKGYTIEQFENPNTFKEGSDYSNLSQIFSQSQVVTVQPFWGNSSLGEKIGITRADINISFKFEPTCVFLGSVISDNSSQGISKKCIPTENMGYMEELTTGEGTIEMIRKTPGGSVEEFQIKGTQLIDGNGVWCYQIPMNLDYMMTDEYGNMIPTDDPNKGIPTRARVRFRVSMNDNEENVDNFFRAKVLVPHNPQNMDEGKHEEYDYEFGSYTKEESFRDLFWNNVYSVKSYIPRFQKRKVAGWKEKKFTGIKSCNFYGSNNPVPYNNIRIRLPFMFTVMCALIKVFIFIVSIINSLTSMLGNFLSDLGDTFIGFKIWKWRVGFYPFKSIYKKSLTLSMSVIKEGLCPDLENWHFAPMFKKNLWSPDKEPPKDYPKYNLLKQTLDKIRDASADDDTQSIDVQNNDEMGANSSEPVCLTIYTDYLISCVEMNLAMEYKVINFDFYNDWLNGTLYFPRFMRYVRPKKKFLGITFVRSKVKGCMDDTSVFSKTRRYTQQCAIAYKSKALENGKTAYTNVENPLFKEKTVKNANKMHKQKGFMQKTIFGKNGGICHEHTTLKGQYVYYMKPCEWTLGTAPANRKVNLFATDIILLGSLNDCDLNGIPQAFKYLSSTSYIMPTNLALTNMETNGPLYVTDNGIMCAGNNYFTEKDVEKEKKVNLAENGLSAELQAYEGTQSKDYNVEYDGNELSDIIALTEAAGISWNYTGPGQGEINPDEFYYPGGHFLGLSCVNSQTNLKSCLNLSRICEVGSNMSQRKEDITSFNENGEPVYTYTVPTGFISGDDIVGSDFRAMFATMNYKRLIATKTNPYTGYKIYDMDFIKPINFDGSFSNVIERYSGKYNAKVEIPEEKTTFLEKIGINIDFNKDSRPDYDQGESANTQTRTIEDTSIDYYLYRLGLTYEDITRTNQKHLRKFLFSNGNYVYLPQYENSYYFYFGLKNGATAIDEFNKQFFSNCENGMLDVGRPNIEISVDGEIDIFDANANIIVSITNLEIPYQYIEILSDVEFITDENGKKVKGIVVKNGDNETTYDDWLTKYSFELSGCPFGTYRVSIMDANGVVYTKTEEIGTNILSFDIEIHDFNGERKKGGKLIHRGGYITVSNVKIDNMKDGHRLEVFIEENGGIDLGDNPSAVFYNGNGGSEMLKVNWPGTHNLKIKYKKDDGSLSMRYTEFLMQTFTIKDSSSLKLMLGVPNILSSGMTISNHYYGWWEDIHDDDRWIERVSFFNEIKPENREKVSSQLKVFALNGTKALWGCPQNSKNGVIEKVYYSENYDEIPNGYMVDDEYLHWPTLNYNTKELPHYSAIVYNNDMVMGNYEAYLDDGSIMYVNDESEKKFKENTGYIFKPVPNGELQFRVCGDGEGGSLLGYSTQDEYNDDIKNGVFYPTISYPSINRPFYAEAKFFCWSRRAIDVITDEMGDETISLMDYDEGGKTEIKIHNGITYASKFSSGSYITNIDNFKDYEVTQNDMYGINIDKDGIDTYKDRIISISGYNANVAQEDGVIIKGESGITTYGYNIMEGHPKDCEQLSNTINNEVNSTFAEYIMYMVNEGKISRPIPDGGVNYIKSGVEYKFAAFNKNVNDESKLLIASKDKYVYKKNGKRTYYVFCTFTSAATYNTEGASIIAKVVKKAASNNVTCSFTMKDENEESYTYTSDKIKFDGSLTDMFDKVFNACPQIRGVMDYKLNYDLDDWGEVLERNTKYFYETIQEGYGDNIVYYAYGKVSGGADLNLYKIYPSIVKISEYEEKDYTPSVEYDGQIAKDEEWLYINVDYWVEEVELLVKGSPINECKVYFNYEDDRQNNKWVTFRPSCSGENTKFYLSLDENKAKESRNTIIVFDFKGTSSGNYYVYVDLTQSGNSLYNDYEFFTTYTSISENVVVPDGTKLITDILLSDNIDISNYEGNVLVKIPKISFSVKQPESSNDESVNIKDFTVKIVEKGSTTSISTRKFNDINVLHGKNYSIAYESIEFESKGMIYEMYISRGLSASFGKLNEEDGDGIVGGNGTIDIDYGAIIKVEGGEYEIYKEVK